MFDRNFLQNSFLGKNKRSRRLGNPYLSYGGPNWIVFNFTKVESKITEKNNYLDAEYP
jgi:hypothetical protein